MSDEFGKRAEDQGAVAIAAVTVKATSSTFWRWFQRYHVDALSVLGITLWLTVRVIEWAMDFADTHYSEEGFQIPAIIGAVLTPWGILQAAMAKWYMELLAKNGKSP